MSEKPANDVETLAVRLAALQTEHRDLDDIIRRIERDGPADRLQMQRLKKRKLNLKDQISWIEKQLLPDIIA
ncbi:MAG: YdcH family protein [Rhodospirillales bacterium]